MLMYRLNDAGLMTLDVEHNDTVAYTALTSMNEPEGWIGRSFAADAPEASLDATDDDLAIGAVAPSTRPSRAIERELASVRSILDESLDDADYSRQYRPELLQRHAALYTEMNAAQTAESCQGDSPVSSTITASFAFQGQEFADVPVINPGGWFGKTWLIELGGSYTPLLLIVEADTMSDAIDELSDDDQYGHQIHVADSDVADYDEETCHRAGNDGRMVDLDHLMIHGREGHGVEVPFPCLYHREGLPAAGLSPLDLDAWPMAREGDTFTVIEYSSYFAVRHNPSGEERPMGDGVDTLFDDDDRPLSPDSEGFVATWTAALNADATETLEVYFPEFHAID